ncbi:MAG: M56 family metallopeptidase, partial [Planctomycetota bacterium]
MSAALPWIHALWVSTLWFGLPLGIALLLGARAPRVQRRLVRLALLLSPVIAGVIFLDLYPRGRALLVVSSQSERPREVRARGSLSSPEQIPAARSGQGSAPGPAPGEAHSLGLDRHPQGASRPAPLAARRPRAETAGRGREVAHRGPAARQRQERHAVRPTDALLPASRSDRTRARSVGSPLKAKEPQSEAAVGALLKEELLLLRERLLPRPAPLPPAAGGGGEAETPSPSVAPYALLGWGAVVLLGLARLLASHLALRRLRRRWRPVEGALLARFRRLAARERRARGCRLFTSSVQREAAALGILRPAIVIPSGWAREMDQASLESLLRHELAHLRHRDPMWRAIGGAVAAIFWPHPLVHPLRRREERLCEYVADLNVLDAGTPARSYARLLGELALRRRARPPVALLATGVLGTRCELERRIRMILGRKRKSRGAGAGGWVSTGLLTACAVLLLTVAFAHPLVGVAAQEGERGRSDIHLKLSEQNGWWVVQGLGRGKGEIEKQLWMVRLAPAKGDTARVSKVRKNSAVVKIGKRSWRFDPRTGQVIRRAPGVAEAPRAAAAAQPPAVPAPPAAAPAPGLPLAPEEVPAGIDGIKRAPFDRADSARAAYEEALRVLAREREEMELEKRRMAEEHRHMERAMRDEIDEYRRALEDQRHEMERALMMEREETYHALGVEREELERALDAERRAMEHALQMEREDIDRAVGTEREELERALDAERQAMEHALQMEREDMERAMTAELEDAERARGRARGGPPHDRILRMLREHPDRSAAEILRILEEPLDRGDPPAARESLARLEEMMASRGGKTAAP